MGGGQLCRLARCQLSAQAACAPKPMHTPPAPDRPAINAEHLGDFMRLISLAQQSDGSMATAFEFDRAPLGSHPTLIGFSTFSDLSAATTSRRAVGCCFRALAIVLFRRVHLDRKTVAAALVAVILMLGRVAYDIAQA